MPGRLVWALHDVRDVDLLVRKRLTRLPAFQALDYQEQEDAVQAMLEAVLHLERKWKRDSAFATFVWTAIPNKLTDYLRRYHKDLRYAHERDTEIFYTDDQTILDSEYWDTTDDVPDEHELLAGIELDELTDAGRETLFKYAIPLRRGQDITTLAELHNVSERWIRRRLLDLAGETYTVVT